MHHAVIVDRITALIFMPAYLSLESIYAEQCVRYAISRGYRLVGVLRDWGEIDHRLRTGRAGLVVVGRGEHSGVQPPESVREQTISIRSGAASARARVPMNAGPSVAREVTAYRTGYNDGFVDCATIAGSRPV